MKLVDVVHNELVLSGLRAPDKASMLEVLVNAAAKVAPRLDCETALHHLVERESRSSTSIGECVAIPHATVRGLDRTLLVVGQFVDPVEYDALDGKPVRLVFLLLSPPGTNEHIRLLSRIARCCVDQDLVSELMDANTPEEILDHLRAEDEKLP